MSKISPLPLPKDTAPKTLIGLMSGTSVDGIDACCARFWVEDNGFRYEILATHTHEISDTLRDRLLACMANQPVLLAELCDLNVQLGESFAEATLGLLSAHGLPASEIAAIGSHGQTVYHLPPQGNTPGSTLQIGEPSVIAERIGIQTIADFRPRDMAAGGQGAPLVPFADILLFQHPTEGRCIQNIGGIGNVTVLPPAGHGEPFAFDTGPGNMLIDGAMARFYQRPYDAEGAMAAQGQVNAGLLETLWTHPYLQELPPKTTGREAFGQAYLDRLLPQFSTLSPPDIVATLTFYTAKTIADAYERFVFPRVSISEVIIGGGGLYNNTLMSHLTALLNQDGRQITLQGHEAYGVPSKYKEALAFAMLAWATLEGIPNNVPSCTGARHPVVMGKVLYSR